MQIVFTRILSGADSLARDLVRLIPAARETLVGSPRAAGAFAPRLVTLMMRPPPRFFMCGRESRQQRTAESSLGSRSCSQAASSTASNEAAAEVPALLTRMSTPPHSRTTSLTNVSIWSAFVTSTDRASTCPPAARIPAAARSSTSGRRAQIATRASSAASLRAAARPSPSLPPVMMATLPPSPRSSIRVSSLCRHIRCRGPAEPPWVVPDAVIPAAGAIILHVLISWRRQRPELSCLPRLHRGEPSMKRRLTFGIFPKLLLTMLVVTLIPLGAIWDLDYRAESESLARQIEQRLSSQADTLAGYVDAWVDMNVRMLRQNAALDDMSSMDAKRQKPLLRAIIAKYKWAS